MTDKDQAAPSKAEATAKRVAETISNGKVIGLLVVSVLAIAFGLGVSWTQAKSKYDATMATIADLQTQVDTLTKSNFATVDDVTTSASATIALFSTATGPDREGKVVGGAVGWNTAMMCEQGSYLAGVVFSGAANGVKYCITCFDHAKPICRAFPK